MSERERRKKVYTRVSERVNVVWYIRIVNERESEREREREKRENSQIDKTNYSNRKNIYAM